MFDKINKVKIFLFAIVLIFSALSWWSVGELFVANMGLANWILAIASLVFLFIFLCLSFVIVSDRKTVILLIVICFLSSTLLSFNGAHLIFTSISAFFAYVGFSLISREKNVIILLDMRRIIRPGKAFVVFAIALTVSSTYYYKVSNYEMDDWIPEIKLGEIGSEIVANMLGLTGKDESGDIRKMTVDEFLINQASKGPELNLESGVIEVPLSDVGQTGLSEAALMSGRNNFSEMLGRDVNGNELILGVLEETVNKKVSDFVGENANNEFAKLIPWSISLALLLAIFSMISFIMPLLVMLVKFVFWLMTKSKIIKIEKINVEREVIAN